MNEENVKTIKVKEKQKEVEKSIKLEKGKTKDFKKDDSSKVQFAKIRNTKILLIFTVTLSLILFLVIVLLVMFPSTFFQPEPDYVVQYRTEFVLEYRDDVLAIFPRELADKLNKEYLNLDTEYLFCLIGERNDNEIYINDIIQPELLYGGNIVITKDDPSCQIENSIGSIHSHPGGGCKPSTNDLFVWGEMKNPEPVINAVQCGVDEFYIMLMPGEHEPIDFSSLRWRIED